MYQLLYPDPALSPFIENYWSVYPVADEEVHLSVEVYVDARADLLFNFGIPYARSIIGGNTSYHANSVLDAHRNVPIRIAQDGKVAMSGVRFRTGGLSPFLGVAAQSLNDKVVPPEVAFGTQIRFLEPQLRELMGNFPAQKMALDTYFLSQLKKTDLIDAFWLQKTRIETESGLINIDRLCSESGVSQRNLDRLFSRFLGFSPKHFARIVRFQKALKLLMNNGQATLSEISERCGYYDQPHFIKDFRLFSGGVPRGYKGYYPPELPRDFAPNLVQFLQDQVVVPK